MVKVITKRKRGRPATRVQRVKVISGGTQVKAKKLGRLRASSILFSPIKDSLKKAKRVLDTKELARQYLKKVRTKK